jgi:uncharacterized lipoprotein YmbA
MRRIKAIFVSYIIASIGLLALFGCAGSSPPVQYYSLHPVSQMSGSPSLSPDISISVGPVVIPPSLDRPQIVTRDAQNNVSFSEYHRWAGPLQEDIAAVVAENLSRMLGSERIATFAGQDVFQPTHRILININRFDSRLAESCMLDATWSIRDLKSKKTVVVRKSTIKAPLSSESYDDLVAANDKALAELSGEMAKEIKQLP